jgi:L-fuconolactonase
MSKETKPMSSQQAETSRRSFLKAGAAGVIALGTMDLLSAQANAAPSVDAASESLRAGPAEQSMMIVDSHCHATPVWYADIDALVFELDRNNVEHAVLVQIGGYFDNEYQFDAVAKHPGRFANVVIGDYTKPDAAENLAKLANRGVSGVRISAPTRSPGDDPFAIWKAAAKLGLSITTGGRSADFTNPEFAQIVEAIPEVPVVIEHLGSTDNPNDDPVGVEVFEQIFSLSRYPNTYIKIHGLGEFTKRTPFPSGPFPFDRPIRPLLDMAYDAFGPQRMMWGSDYPLVNSREGYQRALHLTMDELASKSDEDRAWIFGKTAMKVFPIRA